MLEQNPILLYKLQKGVNPIIEDIIPMVITDTVKQKTMLDFVAWLRENKMTPEWGGLTNSWAWRFKYKGKPILGITMKSKGFTKGWNVLYDECSYFVIPGIDLKKNTETIMDENLKSIIQNNQCYCVHKNKDGRIGVGCNPKKSCAGGMTKTVFGKDIEGICCFGGSENLNTRFYDPGQMEIDCLKRLLELEKQARNENAEAKRK